MIKKCKTPERTHLSKIGAITLFLLVGVISTFGQKSTLNDRNAWWRPIIQRHNIDLNLFNYNNSFTLTKPDTTFNETWLELGKSDSFKNANVTFKDAILISKVKSDSTYYIIRSEIAHHDFDKEELFMEKSTFESFNLNSKDLKPLTSDTTNTIRFDIKKMVMTINMGN